MKTKNAANMNATERKAHIAKLMADIKKRQLAKFGFTMEEFTSDDIFNGNIPKAGK